MQTGARDEAELTRGTGDRAPTADRTRRPVECCEEAVSQRPHLATPETTHLVPDLPVVPGTVVENRRAIWQLGKLQLLDGGADGLARTADNSLFEIEGVFVP